MAVLQADGMNGATLLGFLAAVGSLRLLSEEHPAARLWFVPDGDGARLSVDGLDSQEAIIKRIVERYFSAERLTEIALLSKSDTPKAVRNTADGPEMVSVQKLAEQALDHPGYPQWAFVSSLFCDGIAKGEDDKGESAETVLCAANGASRQKMFVTMRDLANVKFTGDVPYCPLPPLVTPSHLRDSLEAVWTYTDRVPPEAKWMGNRKPTLRWDEGAERLHALRLHDPTEDPEPFTTQLGAYASHSCPRLFPNLSREGGRADFLLQ